ncbi:hypothetical protein EMCRGX_G023476, partial [Ephydatia muelleri]
APVTPRWEETLVLDVHIYGIPHHLVMLPPMMNLEFYDIDIVMAMQLPHYRLHKTFVPTYKSTKTRFSIPPQDYSPYLLLLLLFSSPSSSSLSSSSISSSSSSYLPSHCIHPPPSPPPSLSLLLLQPSFPLHHPSHSSSPPSHPPFLLTPKKKYHAQAAVLPTKEGQPG